jgi:hypothetical protein
MPCPAPKVGGTRFCRHGRSSIELYVFRAAPRASVASNGGTSLLNGRVFIQVQYFIKWALVQYRAVPRASEASDGGTSLISVRNLSRLQ